MGSALSRRAAVGTSSTGSRADESTFMSKCRSAEALKRFSEGGSLTWLFSASDDGEDEDEGNSGGVGSSSDSDRAD